MSSSSGVPLSSPYVGRDELPHPASSSSAPSYATHPTVPSSSSGSQSYSTAEELAAAALSRSLPSSGGGAGSIRPATKEPRQVLRRNMACHQCRRRKLKCDSLRPVCSQCARAQNSFMLSLPPGMPPPSSSEMECVCTYDEMFGPFRKNPAPPSQSQQGGGGSPGSSANGHRAGKRERTNSERGIGAGQRGGRGGSTESEKESDAWSKAHQLEMENFELKRQLQASLQSQQQSQAPPPPNGYSHHPPAGYTSSSRYDHPSSPGPSSHPHHQQPYYSAPSSSHHHPSYQAPGPSAPFQLPQPSQYAPPKSTFPWSSNYPAGSTVTTTYPLSAPGYQESARGGGLVSAPAQRTGPTPPTILEALNIQPTPTTQSQRLAEVPPNADPSSPSTSSVTSANNGTTPHLPPLLNPPATSDPHVHYPFVSQQQQEVFHLPPLASRFSDVKLGNGAAEEGDERDRRDGSSTGSIRPEHMLDGSTLEKGEDGSEWRKRVEDRSRIWALMGGKEMLQKHVEVVLKKAPLLPRLYPPYYPRVVPGTAPGLPPRKLDPLSGEHSSSLVARSKLDPEHPNAMAPCLALAICAFAVAGTPEGHALSAEAGRAILFTRIMAVAGETLESAQSRARRAIDLCQSAAILVAFYHVTGRWAEFHMFASLPLNICDLLGLDPDSPETLPEYALSVLGPPADADECEERRRTIQISRFCGLMCGVCSGRGCVGNFDNASDLTEEFKGITDFSPLALSLQSILLLSRVDTFNRSLRPSPASTSLLGTPELVKKFRQIEKTIDMWVATLGNTAEVGSGPEWEGTNAAGELLALKVLAEHARVLLYYVHLDHSSSNSQRQACLSAAQSISQSCAYAITLPLLSVPVYTLHSYFLAGQVLLRFSAAAEAHRDEQLLAQLNQQLWAISDTFSRLSAVFPVAVNMHKLLDAAIRGGSSAIPRSLAMHFDSSFYAPW